MSGNPLFDAIEDEILSVICLGKPPPKELILDRDEFKWLVALGLTRAGEKVPASETRIFIRVAGHDTWIRSELDPDPWATVH